MTPATRKTVVAWAPAVAYMALIWVLSSLSNPLSVEELPFRDKGAHFLEYGMLAALFSHAFFGTRGNRRAATTFALALGCSVVFGLTDEIHQAYVPSRHASASDFAADALGSLLGAVLYLAVIKLARKRGGARTQAH